MQKIGFLTIALLLLILMVSFQNCGRGVNLQETGIQSPGIDSGDSWVSKMNWLGENGEAFDGTCNFDQPCDIGEISCGIFAGEDELYIWNYGIKIKAVLDTENKTPKPISLKPSILYLKREKKNCVFIPSKPATVCSFYYKTELAAEALSIYELKEDVPKLNIVSNLENFLFDLKFLGDSTYYPPQYNVPANFAFDEVIDGNRFPVNGTAECSLYRGSY